MCGREWVELPGTSPILITLGVMPQCGRRPEMHGSIGAIALALAFVGSHATPQTRPDFSGTWTLTERTFPACIGSLSLSQDADRLRIAPTSPSAPPDIYNFDGTETRQTLAPAFAPDPRPGAWVVKTVGSV